ncbi:MAG: LysR family transcriptional regulator [Hyphomicrobiaceae bacterium]
MSHDTDNLPFDLRSLEIFLAVCGAGNMAAAARRLRITQPAVSLAIAELEKRTGTTLFDRAVRPLALTPAGGLLRQRAAALVDDAREIPALLRSAVHGKPPLLRVGLVDSVVRALTVDAARFLTGRAESVSLLGGLTAAHAGALLTRSLDMLIGVDDLEETPGLERYELTKEPYVLLLPAKTRAVRTLTEFRLLVASRPMVRFSARSQTGSEIERHLRRLDLTPAQWLECEQPFAVTAVVASTDAFAITTPLCVYESGLGSRQVKVCRLPGPQFSRTITLVARHRELGQIPRDMASVMRETLKRLQTQLRRV